MEYFDGSLIESVGFSGYGLVNAVYNSGDRTITVNKDGSASCTKELLFSSRSLKVVLNIGVAEANRYGNGGGYLALSLVYNYGEEVTNTVIPFSMVSLEDSKYIVELELSTKRVTELRWSFKNNSISPLLIRGIEIYKSYDIAPTQIADILKSDVIAGDVIKATANFSEATFTQYLRTNIFSMDAINSIGGSTVDYLTAEDYTLGFYQAKLSQTEKEQFSIKLRGSDGEYKDIFFWYAVIGDSDDAYKYVTTIDPREKYPDILDEERDAFRFMVWRTDKVVKKMSIEFANVSDGQGGETSAPLFILGEGVDPTDPTSLRGKGLIYKDGTGMYVKYVDKNGIERGLVADDTGSYLVGVLIKLQYAKRYRNGLEAKFEGDPTAYKLIFSEDANGDFNGIYVNNRDTFIPSPYIDMELKLE